MEDTDYDIGERLRADAELVFDGRSAFCPWYERIDPLYEMDWLDAASGTWTRPSVGKNSLRINTYGMLEHNTVQEFSPVYRSGYQLYNHRTLYIMAALHQFGQLSTMQLACLLGQSRTSTWRHMSSLYAGGLVKSMIPGWWKRGQSIEESGSGSIWAIDRESWTLERWKDGLTDLQYLIVQAGQDIIGSQNYSITPTATRHNMMSNEIMLRALEASPDVIGVWGESWSEADLLVQVLPDRKDETRANIGDGIIVTRSGKVIVLEVSGSSKMDGRSASERIAEKAGAWVSLCGRSDLDLHVVFVDCSRRPRWKKFSQAVEIGINKLSPRYASSSTVREKGQKRVHVATAYHWFPIQRGVSRDFLGMRSYSPIDKKWVDVIDPEPNLDEPLDKDNDIVVNTLSALHVPSWIAHRP